MNVEWEHPVLPDESWLKSENVRVGSWRYLKLSAVCVTGVLTSDDDAHAVHSVQLVTHNPFGCPSNFGSGHSPYYLISWNKKTWLVEVGTLRGTVSPIPRTDRRKRYPCDGGKLATAMHRNALWKSAKFHRSFLGFWVSFGEETFGKSAKYTAGQKFAGSPGGAKSWIPHKPNRSQLGGAPTQWPLGPRPMQNVGFLWPCISVCAVNNNSMKKLISLKFTSMYETYLHETYLDPICPYQTYLHQSYTHQTLLYQAYLCQTHYTWLSYPSMPWSKLG